MNNIDVSQINQFNDDFNEENNPAFKLRQKLLLLKNELEKPGYYFYQQDINFFRLNYSKINTQHVDIFIAEYL